MRARRGFTLLEAIVALAIVSIVSVGVLAAEGAGLRAEATARTRLPLAAIAQDRLVALDVYDGSLSHLPDSIAVGTLLPVRWHTSAQPVAGARGLWAITVVARSGDDSVVLRTRRHRVDAVRAP